MNMIKLPIFSLLLTLALAGNAFGNTRDFFTVERDYRKCMYPMCGGYWLKNVNRNQTLCADGELNDRCYVVDIKWDATGLTDSQISEIEGWTNITKLIVRGDFEEMTDNPTDLGTFYNLTIAKAWLATTEEDSDGWFVRIYDNGIRCFKAPCNNISEAFLNYDFSFPIADFDLSQSGASDEEIEEAVDAIFDDGVIAIGYNRWYLENWNWATRFHARKIYLPIEPETTVMCKTTGCSGQICSDKEMITICDWRPEYACINMQTCEVQKDGFCGFTPTPESEKCFEGLGETKPAL